MAEFDRRGWLKMAGLATSGRSKSCSARFSNPWERTWVYKVDPVENSFSRGPEDIDRSVA
jgi:hypothetical protein